MKILTALKMSNSAAHHIHSQEKSVGLTGHLYSLLKGIGRQNEILHFFGQCVLVIPNT